MAFRCIMNDTRVNFKMLKNRSMSSKQLETGLFYSTHVEQDTVKHKMSTIVDLQTTLL